jgi:glutamate racemase
LAAEICIIIAFIRSCALRRSFYYGQFPVTNVGFITYVALVKEDNRYQIKGSGVRVSNQQAIAMMDSGVGGLTVVKEMMKQLPHEEMIYFGDTQRAPYGPRSPQEVTRFTEQIVQFLLEFQPKLVVIACNTATAYTYEHIRSKLQIPVIGVIAPSAQAAVRATSLGKIGVIGTEGTIRSQAYDAAIHRIHPKAHLVSLACPTFVLLVEKGLFQGDIVKELVHQELAWMKRQQIDTLILGCTHYPFLHSIIQDCMGPHVTLISSADQTVQDIRLILDQSHQRASRWTRPSHRFYCSGDPITFHKIAHDWLNTPLEVHSVVW